MTDNYVVDAAACYAFPTAGGAVLLYRGAAFPADSTNLDDMLESEMVVKVKEVVGGLPSDLPPIPDSADDKSVKPGPAVKTASKS